MFLVKRHYKYHQTLEWSRSFVQRPPHRLFFRPNTFVHVSFSWQRAKVKLKVGKRKEMKISAPRKWLWSLFKHTSPDRHGSMIFVASQTIDQMKRFCATEVMEVTELFHLPILRVSVLEATSPCHRLVYPFLSQVNCSGGTWSQCSAVLCRGCLLTIRILQMREKYPCQHPPSQCRRLSSYRPSLMHSRTREEQKKLAGEQTFWKPSFSKTMWIR